jgi:hypothetical protein
MEGGAAAGARRAIGLDDVRPALERRIEARALDLERHPGVARAQPFERRAR